MLVEAASGKVLATLNHGTWVTHVAFSPDGNSLATVCADGKAYLWNVRTGQEITRLETHSGPGVRVQFSPDGRQLAAVTRGDEAPFADLATNEGRPVPETPLGTAHVFVWSGLDGE